MMRFKFQDGDQVVLKNGEDHAWFLAAGSQGVVFCRYATKPPAYEVNFRDLRDEEVGAVVYEAEIELMREEMKSLKREAVQPA